MENTLVAVLPKEFCLEWLRLTELRRLYECLICKTLTIHEHQNINRPSMHTIGVHCEVCGDSTQHRRHQNGFPGYNKNSHGGIPNATTDVTEYEGWQRNAYKEAKEMTHPDNLKPEQYKGVDYLTKKK